MYIYIYKIAHVFIQHNIYIHVNMNAAYLYVKEMLYVHIDIRSISMIPNTVCQVKLASLPSRLLASSLSCPICQRTARLTVRSLKMRFVYENLMRFTPPKINMSLKRDNFNRKCIFQPLFFRGDVFFFPGSSP